MSEVLNSSLRATALTSVLGSKERALRTPEPISKQGYGIVCDNWQEGSLENAVQRLNVVGMEVDKAIV